jgi:hypothetical protein
VLVSLRVEIGRKVEKAVNVTDPWFQKVADPAADRSISRLKIGIPPIQGPEVGALCS